MPYRLFYISECHVDPCGPEPRKILDLGTSRNTALGVTGLLCCSGQHFAQVLEGSSDALAALMASIRRDPRHTLQLEWPAELADGERWFRGWSLAYLFDDRLEALLRSLLGQRQSSLPEVTRELIRDVDFFQGKSA